MPVPYINLELGAEGVDPPVIPFSCVNGAQPFQLALRNAIFFHGGMTRQVRSPLEMLLL